MKITSFYKKSNKAPREKWIRQALKEVPENHKLLDAGAGELQYKKYCEHLQYVSQDLGTYDGTGNGEGLQVGERDNSRLDIKSDIIDIPVEDQSFDAILCIEVFEHIPEPIKALEEFGRILKKGGVAIITVPVSSYTHYAPQYFYNGFSKYFFEKFLSDNGFEIEELSFNGNYFTYLFSMVTAVPSVTKRYMGFGGKLFKGIYLLMMTPLLLLINYMAKMGDGSSEMHSTGIHVKARKIV